MLFRGDEDGYLNLEDKYFETIQDVYTHARMVAELSHEAAIAVTREYVARHPFTDGVYFANGVRVSFKPTPMDDFTGFDASTILVRDHTMPTNNDNLVSMPTRHHPWCRDQCYFGCPVYMIGDEVQIDPSRTLVVEIPRFDAHDYAAVREHLGVPEANVVEVARHKFKLSFQHNGETFEKTVDKSWASFLYPEDVGDNRELIKQWSVYMVPVNGCRPVYCTSECNGRCTFDCPTQIFSDRRPNGLRL
jgi:hypothetical protein